MASIADTSEEHIRRLNRDSERLEAETRKLMAEATKLGAEQLKLSAERDKLHGDLRVMPYAAIFQGFIAIAAMLGAGAAIAKLFFS